MSIICIYHGNCTDGFGAAWALREFYRCNGVAENRIEFIPGVYGEPIPDVKDKVVFILDFSYSRDELIKMAMTAKCISVIDHHKTSKKNLVDLPSNIEVVFDMNKSGTMLTWEYFFGDPCDTDYFSQPPKLLEHIQDRDLWRFKLHGTQEISAALFSYEYDFKVWDKLILEGTDKLFKEGQCIARKHSKDIAEFILHAESRMTLGNYNVPCLNVPYFYASEAGQWLSKGEDFSATWYDTNDERVFSLRSSADGIDVSVVAEEFGGGGHEHAAGFKIKLCDIVKILGD